MDNFMRRRVLGLISGGLCVANGRVLSGFAMSALAGCAGTGREFSYTRSFLLPENDSAVFRWTDVMLQAARDLSLSPLEASRGFAMAHMAGNIALNGGENTLLDQLKAPEELEPELAYGVAFSHALEEAWSTSLAPHRREWVGLFHDARFKHASIEWGKTAARAVIRWRIRDGAEPSRSEFYPPEYPRRTDKLAWSPTGPLYGARSGPAFETFQRGQSPGWGAQKTWAIGDVSKYEADPFPDYHSREFMRQFKKVADLGASDSKIRTNEQSEIALFWEDGPRGVTLPGHFQLIAIDVVQRRKWSLRKQARFFFLFSMAQADSAIVAWHSKYKEDIVRPETAIRFAATRFPGLHGLSQRSRWKSYIPTPAFPSYVSGHSVFGAASARVMSLILDSDRINVTGMAPDLTNWPLQLSGVTRTWRSLQALAEENGASREYGGVHWESDNLQGLRLGYKIAETVVANSSWSASG